ncbi:MAG: 4Fe-4S dicluster domain-containing protein, partial [Candidatus Dadabacteria bacterium]
VLSGVLLLFFYKPSIFLAWHSVYQSEARFNIKLFLHTVHRYASDGFMFFIIVHTIKAISEGRFVRGFRWSWWTGIGLAFLMWTAGWSGYFLLWDSTSSQVGIFTAKALDYLPIFPDILKRSFVDERSVGSLLFFLIFFVHISFAIAFVIGLWIHISRLRRTRYFFKKNVVYKLGLFLLFFSFFFPVSQQPKADLLSTKAVVQGDLFYLTPLILEKYLSFKTVLFLMFAGFFVLLIFPVFERRRKERQAPYVLSKRCTACRQCFQDCPYGAISMKKTEEGREAAFINPELCIECGVCVGACDPQGIVFPQLPIIDSRKKLRDWLRKSKGEKKGVVFVCAQGAGMDLRIKEEDGTCEEIPEAFVLPVTCTGWIHPTFFELLAREGVSKVLVVGCGETAPYHRWGARLAQRRIKGERHPRLRIDKIKELDIMYIHYGADDFEGFLNSAEKFFSEAEEEVKDKVKTFRWGRKVRRAFVEGVSLIIFGFILFAGFSNFAGVSIGTYDKALLVLSLKAEGVPVKVEERKDNSALLPHMRAKGAVRVERHPVSARILVDGKEVLSAKFKPIGIFKEGDSVGYKEVFIKPGRRKVVLFLDKNGDNNPELKVEKNIVFKKGRKVVLEVDNNEIKWWWKNDHVYPAKWTDQLSGSGFNIR